jgi:hypothetical protein
VNIYKINDTNKHDSSKPKKKKKNSKGYCEPGTLCIGREIENKADKFIIREKILFTHGRKMGKAKS